MMTLDGLELYVADLERSLAFYRDVLGGSETAVSEPNLIKVRLSDKLLQLRPTPAPTPSALTLTFLSSNLPEMLAHLARCGVTVCLDGKTAACYHFFDPDGNRIRLQKE